MEGIDMELSEWLVSKMGFRHNASDNTHTKRLSEHFSVEVDADLSLHIVCDSGASLTGIESLQVSFDRILLLATVERVLANTVSIQKEQGLVNNVNALLKMSYR